MKRVLILAAIAAGLLSAAGIASASTVRHCPDPPVGSSVSHRGGHVYGYYIVGDIITRKMTCSAAIRAIKRGRETRHGGLSTPGFSCRIVKVYRAENVIAGEVIKCVARSRWFQFSWAT